MTNETVNLFIAFAIGLSGGLHCIAMCGGIGAALGYASTQADLKLLAYNLGRIFSYTLIGLLFGSLSQILDTRSALAHRLLQTLSSLLLFAIALHISGLWRGLTVLEKSGARVWAYLQPLALKLMPVDTRRKAFCFGLLWGWLPCGLVYSTLTWSAASGSAVYSAALMACFGIGTLPWLLAANLAGRRVNTLVRQGAFKYLLAAILVCLGTFSLYQNLSSSHAHAAPTEQQSHQHH